jgi:acyl-coenzyme A synthetase/AMP-(fatty) acid ligase
LNDTDIIYIDNSGERKNYLLNELKKSVSLVKKDAATFDAAGKPELFALLHKALEEGVTPVLFDHKMQSIAERVESLGVTSYDSEADVSALPASAYAVFFTSGTTGVPTGAIKREQNIQGELDALTKLFEKEAFERVIVTVPFIHIYGFLTGVMLPLRLGCEVLFKEEYLPQDLLKLHEGKKTLVVTSPVYLKSLLRLRQEHDLGNVLFLSSTGLLLEDEVGEFQQRYSTRVIQLFGSTETGGIAVKKGTQSLWEPLDGVHISQNHEGVMIVNSPYLSTHLFEEKVFLTPRPYMTTDIIEKEGDSFRLLGRLDEIIKISGKRISVLEIEALLQEHTAIKEALVTIERDSKRLKDETLIIKLVSKAKLEKKDVLALLKECYPQIHFDFQLLTVEKIEKNSMGKKVRH